MVALYINSDENFASIFKYSYANRIVRIRSTLRCDCMIMKKKAEKLGRKFMSGKFTIHPYFEASWFQPILQSLCMQMSCTFLNAKGCIISILYSTPTVNGLL